MTLPMPDPPLSDGVVSLRPPDERDLPAIEQGIHDPDVISAFGRPTLARAELLELNSSRWQRDEDKGIAVMPSRDSLDLTGKRVMHR